MKPRGVIRGAIAGMLIAFGATIISSIAPSSVAAENAVAPAGSVLVVNGQTADGQSVSFDLAQLKALPAITIKTMTPWSEGESEFEGVRLRDLLAKVGAKAGDVSAAAVDEYQVTIPAEDFQDYDVIVAYAMNGQPLAADNKGPLWIVYPFSTHSGLQKDIYYARCVWQLNRLTVQ